MPRNPEESPEQMVQRLKVVKDIAQMLDYGDYGLAKLEVEEGRAAVLRLQDFLENMTLTTAFTGIDAICTGALELWQAVQRYLGIIMKSTFQNLAGCDMSAECCRENMAHPHGPRCFFGNVDGFLSNTGKKIVDRVLKRGSPMGE